MSLVSADDGVDNANVDMHNDFVSAEIPEFPVLIDQFELVLAEIAPIAVRLEDQDISIEDHNMLCDMCADSCGDDEIILESSCVCQAFDSSLDYQCGHDVPENSRSRPFLPRSG